MSEWKPFRAKDINLVLSSVSGAIASGVRERIMGAVDASLGDYLTGVMNLTSLDDLGTPQVMIRVRTFQTILDEFRKQLDDRYSRVLERIGLNIGFNFGISLIKILNNSHWMALDYEAVLKFWALFDSSAQIGNVDFDLKSNDSDAATVHVRIKRLFLTLGYGADEPLRHASFMLGYLLGAADVTAMLWTRWIRQSDWQNPKRAWRALGCEVAGTDKDDISAFQIALREEAFPDVRDTFVRAINASEEGKYVDAMMAARICLEESLRRVAGHPSETRVSFGRLLEEIDGVRADLVFENWKIAYDVCSKYAHQINAENAVLSNLFLVWECVRDAENVVLSSEQRANLADAQHKYLLP
jgi:hypothetical protein